MATSPRQEDVMMLKHAKTAGIDEREVRGLRTKTFYDEHGDVQIVIATGAGSTIVAIPKSAIGRDNHMGDDEYECLKKCIAIEDLEKRLNCILQCPASESFDVFIA